MPNPLPPETTPEWTEQDEVDLRDFARFIGPDFTPSAKAAYRFAREIRRLRSEREAQGAEIAKLGRQHQQPGAGGEDSVRPEVLRGLHASGVSAAEVTHRNADVTVGNSTDGHGAAGELLPCPFCGCQVTDADVDDENEYTAFTPYYRVVCLGCGSMCDGHEDCGAAVMNWNRRASVPNTGTALSVREMQAINARRSPSLPSSPSPQEEPMAETMQGRRIESPFAANGGLIGEWPKPGEYWFWPDQGWQGVTPNGHLAGLAKHNVVEHEDGTITVSPSIAVRGTNYTDAGIRVTDGVQELWHGFLERGVWREC